MADTALDKGKRQDEAPTPRCNAKKKNGKPCGAYAIKESDSGKCRMHCGKSTEQILHWRHQQSVKAFGARVTALAQDPDLHRFEPDLVLFDVRMTELLERLKEDDAPAWRAELVSLAGQLDDCFKIYNPEKRWGAIQNAWAELRACIARGATRDQAWADLEKNRNDRSALLTRTVNAAAQKAKVLTDADMVLLFQRMVELAEEEYGERQAARLIHRFEREVFSGASSVAGGQGALGEGQGPPA